MWVIDGLGLFFDMLFMVVYKYKKALADDQGLVHEFNVCIAHQSEHTQ